MNESSVGAYSELGERIFFFSVNVVNLTNDLPNNLAGRNIAQQLFRSGTSVAANYEEACAAESRADFVHKLRVSLKESRESRFWLRLLSHTISKSDENCKQLYQEACELCNILGKSIVTAKKSQKSKKAEYTDCEI